MPTVHPIAGRLIRAAEVAEHFRDYISTLDRVAEGFGILTTQASLTAQIQPGAAYVSGKKIGLDTDTANTAITLVANATNHVYLTLAETIVVNQSGVAPANSIKIYTVVTDNDGVDNPSTDITDHRDDFLVRLAVGLLATELRSTGDLVTPTIGPSGSVQHTVPGGVPDQIATEAYVDAAILGGGAPFDDAAHGNRGGGTLHAAVTGATNGFMIAADKAILDAATAAETANALVKRDSVGGTALRALTMRGAELGELGRTGQTRTITYAASGGSDADGAWQTGQVTDIAEDGVTVKLRYDSSNGYRWSKTIKVAGGKTETLVPTYDGSGRVASIARTVA